MNLARLAIMGVLALAVHYAPQFTPSFAPRASADPATIIRQLQEIQVQAAQQHFANQPEEIQNLLRDVNAGSNSHAEVDPEIASQLRAINSAGSMQAPVLEKLIESIQQKQNPESGVGNTVWSHWISAQKWYLKNKSDMEPWLWGVPIAGVLLSLLAFVLSQVSSARRLAAIGYALAKQWLWLLSWLAIGLAMTTGSNPWPAVPSELVMPPIAWFVGSALILSLVDMNYPIWNSLVRGCTAPLISMVFILGVQQLRVIAG